MKTQTYTTKTGKTQYRPVLSVRAMEERVNEGTEGFCLACGAEVEGVEPDARRYPCESCGAPNKVYGLAELLMMGLLIVR